MRRTRLFGLFAAASLFGVTVYFEDICIGGSGVQETRKETGRLRVSMNPYKPNMNCTLMILPDAREFVVVRIYNIDLPPKDVNGICRDGLKIYSFNEDGNEIVYGGGVQCGNQTNQRYYPSDTSSIYLAFTSSSQTNIKYSGFDIVFTGVLGVGGSCTNTTFQCEPGYCISMNLVCDRIDNCGDGSDEIGCLNENNENEDLYFWLIIGGAILVVIITIVIVVVCVVKARRRKRREQAEQEANQARDNSRHDRPASNLALVSNIHAQKIDQSGTDNPAIDQSTRGYDDASTNHGEGIPRPQVVRREDHVDGIGIDRERDRDIGRGRDIDRDRDTGRERDIGRERDMDRDRDMRREMDIDRGRDFDRDRDTSREIGRDGDSGRGPGRSRYADRDTGMGGDGRPEEQRANSPRGLDGGVVISMSRAEYHRRMYGPSDQDLRDSFRDQGKVRAKDSVIYVSSDVNPDRPRSGSAARQLQYPDVERSRSSSQLRSQSPMYMQGSAQNVHRSKSPVYDEPYAGPYYPQGPQRVSAYDRDPYRGPSYPRPQSPTNRGSDVIRQPSYDRSYQPMDEGPRRGGRLSPEAQFGGAGFSQIRRSDNMEEKYRDIPPMQIPRAPDTDVVGAAGPDLLSTSPKSPVQYGVKVLPTLY